MEERMQWCEDYVFPHGWTTSYWLRSGTTWFHTSLGQVKWAKTAIKVSAVTTLGVGVEGRTWHAAATGKARSATVKRWVFTAHIVYIHKTLFKWWQTASQLQYKLCAWRHNMPRPFPPPWVPKRLTRRRADAM